MGWPKWPALFVDPEICVNFLTAASVFPKQFHPAEAIMKKFGFLVFAAAIIFGVIISSFFSFGKADYKLFNFSFNKKVRGSGNIATESREVTGFKGIDVSGVFQVEIKAQQDFAVEVEADDNLLPLIKTEVRNGILHIDSVDRISSHNGLTVRISAPNIDSIQASGASKVNLVDLNNDDLRVDTSGASKIFVYGETARLEVEVSGASSIDAENLKAENASVNASGASHVSLFATAELNADASGASRIVYSGKPGNLRKDVSGASSIREK